jgi:hypothetical protein
MSDNEKLAEKPDHAKIIQVLTFKRKSSNKKHRHPILVLKIWLDQNIVVEMTNDTNDKPLSEYDQKLWFSNAIYNGINQVRDTITK